MGAWFGKIWLSQHALLLFFVLYVFFFHNFYITLITEEQHGLPEGCPSWTRIHDAMFRYGRHRWTRIGGRFFRYCVIFSLSLFLFPLLKKESIKIKAD